jgi:hypothetical protein
MKRDGTKPVAASHEVAVAPMVISKRSGKRGGALSNRSKGLGVSRTRFWVTRA